MNTHSGQRRDPATIQYIPHISPCSRVFEASHDQSHNIVEGMEFYRLEWEKLDDDGLLNQHHEFVQVFEAHLHVTYDEIERWENANAQRMSNWRWRDRDLKYQYGKGTGMDAAN
jgi:hypothetical protein